AVPAVRGAARLRPAAPDLALPPPPAGLPDHRYRHAIAQGQAQRPAAARHEAAVLPQAVGYSRRGVRRMDRSPGGQGPRPRVPRMTGPTHRPAPAAPLLAIALTAGLPSAGCESAVKHPAITAGIVGATMGFTTCKLGSDNLGACLAVGGGAAALLGLVAATALW